MAKFYGAVGYGQTVETAPGVQTQVITERKYFGDLLRNANRLTEGENLNKDIQVNNSISVVADAFAMEHFHEILYVEWAGTRWSVTTVEVLRPRLNIRLGGVYNGQTPETAPEAPGDPGDE